ncbi:MAG: hypothetical protein ACXAC8_03615 [Candidatus Hodarchaeales archaeon]|jgi:hypothetical protein
MNLTTLRKDQQRFEDRVTGAVHVAVDDFGKKKFSNVTLRKVEINTLLDQSEEYQQLQTQIT